MKKIRIFLILIAIVTVFSIPSFAAEKTNLNPSAVYELTDNAGQPVSIRFDYTHCQFVDFPNEGDTVKIWLDGNKNKAPDEVAVYTKNGSSGEGFYKQSDDKVSLGVIGQNGKDYDVYSKTVDLRFYYSASSRAYKYNITQKTKVEAVSPAITGLQYSISNISVTPEQVSMYDEYGNQYYSFSVRERHIAPNGEKIASSFRPGESVKVFFSDGTSKFYYGKDIQTSSGRWIVGFVSADGDVLELFAEDPIDGAWIKKGDNDVKIYIYGRKDVSPYILKVHLGDSPPAPAVQPKVKATLKVALSKTSFTWNGNTQTPNVAVYVNNKVLPRTKYSLSYSNGRKNVGTYTINVALKNGYSGTAKVSYKIVPKGCSISRLKPQKNAMTVKWKPQTAKMSKGRVSGYQIQYSPRKTFLSGFKPKTVKGYKKSSVKISGLKSKKTYYVRIRTYMTIAGKNHYSGWSPIKTVKVK